MGGRYKHLSPAPVTAVPVSRFTAELTVAPATRSEPNAPLGFSVDDVPICGGAGGQPDCDEEAHVDENDSEHKSRGEKLASVMYPH